jgi:anti-sigma factor RsiW
MAIPHINEDDLEFYALGRLAEAQAAPVEEHLLVCEECRVRLAEWDGYTRVMREAMRRAAVNRR